METHNMLTLTYASYSFLPPALHVRLLYLRHPVAQLHVVVDASDSCGAATKGVGVAHIGRDSRIGREPARLPQWQGAAREPGRQH